jgi:hypothetical protein
MKLGFICLNAPGHINPMTTLARRLQGRDRRVAGSDQDRRPALKILPFALIRSIERPPEELL